MNDNKPATRTLVRLTYALLAMTLVLIVVAAALATQVTNRNETIETTQTQVDDIQGYVNELREPPTEEEVLQQEAVTVAVQLVPSIKDILCEAFPDAEGCQEDSS